MALIPIKTASETGYCDCICGCYELASLRDEDTGKGYCPACAKDHIDLNAGVGIPQPVAQSCQQPCLRRNALPCRPSRPSAVNSPGGIKNRRKCSPALHCPEL
ncbi:MAG: hypothetical protein DMG43_10045 [Acidobacteria bacterium]|nr:MAG: hypothetical protein DMG43_10045 [Acidobacteriota bacterium]